VPATCGNGVVEEGEACDPAEGEPSECCQDCRYKTSETVCRAAVDICDRVEYCSGTQAGCPIDAKQPAGFPCRSANGLLCDIEEVCDGVSDVCPADVLRPASHVCRPVAGGCDVAETCTGVSPACPTDAVLSDAELCRPVAGVCDVPEYCSGTSATCPADVVLGATTVCRTAASACDAEEFCTGVTATCPPDKLVDVGSPCNDGSMCTTEDACTAEGTCEGAFTCTCTVDTDCDDGNPCSLDSCVAGSCVYETGSNRVCRPAVDLCDVEERCSPTSTECPVDTVKPDGTVCREAAGLCDAREVCNGVSPFCTADVKLGTTTVCRGAAGGCDVAEVCDGSSNDCPSDVLLAAGTVCRNASGACDEAERCTGSSTLCPLDESLPVGSACDDGLQCTAPDLCLSDGSCAGKYFCQCMSDEQCDDGNACTHDVCDVAGGKCVYTNVEAGNVNVTCSDGNSCTLNDVCDGMGQCYGLAPPCADGCEYHGLCCGGECLCEGGWFGEACDLNVGSGAAYEAFDWCSVTVVATEDASSDSGSASAGDGEEAVASIVSTGSQSLVKEEVDGCAIFPFLLYRDVLDGKAEAVITLDSLAAAQTAPVAPGSAPTQLHLRALNGGALRVGIDGTLGVDADGAGDAQAELDGVLGTDAIMLWFDVPMTMQGIRFAGLENVVAQVSQENMMTAAEVAEAVSDTGSGEGGGEGAASKRSSQRKRQPGTREQAIVEFFAEVDDTTETTMRSLGSIVTSANVVDLRSADRSLVAAGMRVSWGLGDGFSLVDVSAAPEAGSDAAALVEEKEGGGGGSGGNVGAIVGGVIGGICACCLLIALTVFAVRKRQSSLDQKSSKAALATNTVPMRAFGSEDTYRTLPVGGAAAAGEGDTYRAMPYGTAGPAAPGKRRSRSNSRSRTAESTYSAVGAPSPSSGAYRPIGNPSPSSGAYRSIQPEGTYGTVGSVSSSSDAYRQMPYGPAAPSAKSYGTVGQSSEGTMIARPGDAYRPISPAGPPAPSDKAKRRSQRKSQRLSQKLRQDKQSGLYAPVDSFKPAAPTNQYRPVQASSSSLPGSHHGPPAKQSSFYAAGPVAPAKGPPPPPPGTQGKTYGTTGPMARPARGPPGPPASLASGPLSPRSGTGPISPRAGTGPIRPPVSPRGASAAPLPPPLAGGRGRGRGGFRGGRGRGTGPVAPGRF